MSAASLAQRLRKMREAGGYSVSAGRPSTTASTLSGRLARMRAAQRGGREEEEEERGLLSRIYYGEEKGEGGRMGIEDIPGQFADVVTSPYEKGLKPLIDIGAGAGKIALGQEEDEDTRLARMAGSEFVDSVTGLPEAFRSGYPVEGVMNLASVAAIPLSGGASLAAKVPKLGTLAKASKQLGRAANIAADPTSAAIGGAARGIAAGGRAAKGAVTGRKRDVTDGDADALKMDDIRKPGRTIRQEVAEYIQSFTTSLPQPAVGRMYDYFIDPDKRTRNYEVMKEARNNPDEAIKSIVNKVQDRIQEMRDIESPAYAKAKKEYQAAEGIAGKNIATDFRAKGGDVIGDKVDKLLGPTKDDTGFGGQLVVRWREKAGIDADGNDVFRDVETPWANRNTIPNDAPYQYDIKWERDGIKSELPGRQQDVFRNELLANVLQSSSGLTVGNSPISFNNILALSKKFESELGTYSARMEMGQTDKFRARLRGVRREIVKDAAGTEAADKFTAAENAYRQHKVKLDQIQEDYGRKIGDTDVDHKQQRSKLLGEVLESDGRLDQLKELAGDDAVLQLLGAAHQSPFGGGLVVRSNFSNLLRGIAGLGVAFTAGGLTSALAGIPLLAAFSPQAMLPISRRLAASPLANRAIRGDRPQISEMGITKTVTETVKGAEQLLGKQGVNLRQLAQQGMTFGQLMQRLEREAEREQRQG
jgi:hypothetical protein